MNQGFWKFNAIFLLLLAACSAGTPGGGSATIGSGQSFGNGNGAAPETPPSTVELAPGCPEGLKPEPGCPGTKLPVKPEVCPLSMPVVINEAQGIWWCECPPDTQQIQYSPRLQDRRCICPSGKYLKVDPTTGASLGCQEEDRQAGPACPGQLILLNAEKPSGPAKNQIDPSYNYKQNLANQMRRNEQIKFSICGCPAGSQKFIGAGEMAGIQSCVCPSGQNIPVDPDSGRALKSCEELIAPCPEGLVYLGSSNRQQGEPNHCGCPNVPGVEELILENGQLACVCPGRISLIKVDPQTSEFLGCSPKD